MKKALLLATIAITALTASAQQKGYAVPVANLPASSKPVPGKKYLIYDNVKLNADGTAAGTDNDKSSLCFRGVRAADNIIIGNTSVAPTSSSGESLDAHYYVWTAEGSENAVSFKNEYKNLYIPAAADAVMDLSATAGVFEFMEYSIGFVVKNTTNNYVWDGDNGGGNRTPSHRMVGWSKRDDLNDNHTYTFYEVTDDILTESNKSQIIYVLRVGQHETVFYNDYLENGSPMPAFSDEYYAPADFPTTVTEPGRYVFTNNEVEVTYTFAHPVEGTFSVFAELAPGEDAAAHVPSYDFFSKTGLAETNTIVSESNKTFTVNGSWTYPFVINRVYRMDLRASSSNNCANWFYNAETGQIETRTTTANTTTSPNDMVAERLFYLTCKSFDNGVMTVNLHALAADPSYAFNVGTGNNNKGTISSTPTDFYVVPNSNGTAGVSLRHSGASTGHLNDIVGYLGVWVDADSQNDGGSYIRFLSLSDEDFDIFTDATAEEIEAAKANPTYTAIANLFAGLDPIVVARKKLNDAIAAADAFAKPIGASVGQYNNADRNFATLLANAKVVAADENATAEELDAAAASIAISTLIINQPGVGYYRLKHGTSYLSNTITANTTYPNRLAVIVEATANNLNNTTVFFYDGIHFVSFPDGLVLDNLSGGNNGHQLVLASASNAGNDILFSESREVSKYNIKVNGRYLYHRADCIDSGTGTNNDAGYCWELEPVTWLPVPHDAANSHLSLCVPADLNITGYGRAQHHRGVIQGSNLGIAPHEDAILAAGTPAVLEYKSGIAHDCIYFQITGYPEVAAQADNDVANDLTAADGSYWLAQAPSEGKTYYVVQGGQLVQFSGDTLPANAAFVVFDTPAEDEAPLPASFAIADYDDNPTSIVGITEAVNAGADAIFDLQGRRVNRATRGLYIINGKKVIR